MSFSFPRAGRAAVIGAALAGLAFAAAALDAPPKAPSQPVTDTYFGVKVTDPYRNLEDLKNPATRAWLDAQGAHTADVLQQIDGRDAIAQRVAELGKASGAAVASIRRMPGERLYYLRRLAGENQMKLVTRTGLSGAERVLVDPEQMARQSGVPHAINWFVPSWDGKTLAYGVSAGGSEDASMHLMDIATGAAIGAPVPRVHEGLVHWTPDSRRLTYNQLRTLPAGAADTETYLDSTVYLIAPRERDAAPRALFGPLVNTELKLDRLDVAEVSFAPGSRWMIARTTDTTAPEGRLYVAPLAQLGEKKIAWRAISTFADKITEVGLRGDTLYLRTYAGAPRGRVLALALADPVLAKATTAVPEPESGVLEHFTLGRGSVVYAEVREGFNTRLRRYADAGGKGVDVAPTLPGSAYRIDDPAHAYDDAWVQNSTWTDPPRVVALGRDGRATDTGLMRSVRPAGSPEIEVSEVMVRSHDGALVPLAVLRRKGLALNGDNPTLLIGYGAYGFSFDAGFDPRRAAWLERGGVIAMANVRGSGAFGDAWYRAGFKGTKPNTWKDGIACARWLIEQKFASAKTLGVWGTSAGGIFVGRTVTSAPELFAAAIFDVGDLDMVRSEESANGITNTSEFGSNKNAQEFPWLLEMSTYHHITDGTAYPAVMLIHGLNDPRVDVWHSAKVGARLQAATSSGKPILLRLDGQAGHGIGSTNAQRASKQADIYSFLLWQFGKTALKQP